MNVRIHKEIAQGEWRVNYIADTKIVSIGKNPTTYKQVKVLANFLYIDNENEIHYHLNQLLKYS